MSSNPFELQDGEDSNARYERFNRDYHSDDRDAVLADAKNGTGAFAPRQQAPPPPSSPFNGRTYEDARNAWQSGQYGLDATRWGKDFNINVNGDTATLPNGGGMIDIISNYAGGRGNGQSMGNTWTPAGGNGSNPGGVGLGSGSIGGGYSSSVSQTGGLGSNLNSKWDSLYGQLMDRAKQGTQISPDDPNIRQQVEPYAAQVEREKRNYLADMAESQGPLANMRGETRVANEHAGQATGLFQSQLIGRELDSKRQEIQAALSQMGGMLTEQQQMALQKELSYLNDATQRYGIDSNANIAQGQLGLGRDNLGYNIGRSDMDYFLRSQGL